MSRENYGIVQQNADRVLQWVKDGLSAYRIAKELKCAPCSIKNFLRTRGISTQHKCKVNYNHLLKDYEQEVIALYNQGMSTDDIGKQLGFAGANIWKLIQKSDLRHREPHYHVNEHFFDKVDSEVVAYVLGWFYSDGCVDKNGKLRIQVQKEDEAILYQIKDLMEYEGPLYEVPPPKKYPHRKAQVSLTINRKSLAYKLISLGCVPNKSCVITLPSFEIVSEHLFHHFIRGVFDGDGSVSIKSGKYLNISITSCENFIQPLRQYLRTKLQIDTKHYYRYEHTNTLQMMITTTADAVKFLEWIYQDANFYLERKFLKYQEWRQKGV